MEVTTETVHYIVDRISDGNTRDAIRLLLEAVSIVRPTEGAIAQAVAAAAAEAIDEVKEIVEGPSEEEAPRDTEEEAPTTEGDDTPLPEPLTS